MDGHEGHRQRLRKRFLDTELEGFQEHEVLELLLSFAIARKDVKPLAKELISKFGSLSKVLEADYLSLINQNGIGENSASLIKFILPLIKSYLKSKDGQITKLSDINTIKAYARTLLFGEANENFEIIALGSNHKILAKERISSGDDRQSAVFPRKVMAFLLSVGASYAIIAHNHPSGNPNPSKQDIDLSLALKDTLSRVSIELIDHIIIAANEAYSLKENKLI